MGSQVHLDLDLLFARTERGFQVKVLRSPAGEGQSAAFTAPFTDLELENFGLKVGRSRARTRRIEAAPVSAAKEFGGRLFDAVFADEVRECLRRSLDQAKDQQATLRIRFRLTDCPELANLPWELLYDASDDWFVALSVGTPVVRYLQLPDPPRAVRVSLPLHVLVIRSEPIDYPPLDLDDEWAQISASVQELTDSGLVAFTVLSAPTLSELRRALLRGEFHVMHYMGHGGFDPDTGGVLLFTDRDGRGVAVTAADLGVILRDHSSMRLAVLNACEGARSDPADPFAGVAETLVRRGVPAVVAMQYEFSDIAAIEFAPALYGALAAGLPVDGAVTEARKAVYAVSPLEWATPVLHMRAEDAQLFSLVGAPQPTRPHKADPPPPQDSRPPTSQPPQPDPAARSEPIGDSRRAGSSAPGGAAPGGRAAATAVISIRRRKGARSEGIYAYWVLIDGNRAGKLRPGATGIYQVAPGTHRVQLKYSWVSSPEATVELAMGESAAFVCGAGASPSTLEAMRPSVFKSELKRQFTAQDSFIDLQRE
jgi:hypothetical protein